MILLSLKLILMVYLGTLVSYVFMTFTKIPNMQANTSFSYELHNKDVHFAIPLTSLFPFPITKTFPLPYSLLITGIKKNSCMCNNT
jgi:hypothetical protein